MKKKTFYQISFQNSQQVYIGHFTEVDIVKVKNTGAA